MDVAAIQAIDVHAHYGWMFRGRDPIMDVWCSGDGGMVARRAREVNVEHTIVSPLKSLMPRGQANAYDGNEEAAKVVAETEGLLQWSVVNPLQPSTYEQTERMLGLPKCVGVKIHPEEHCYPIKEHGRKMFEFFARHKMLVLTHSGEGNSLPPDFIPFCNDFPEVTLILAHIGCSHDNDLTRQVRAVQMSRHGNLYTDTSSMMSTLSGILEWAVKELGPEKILFGTDTPLYSTASQRARINYAEMSDAAKKMILRDNAEKLLEPKLSAVAR